jgi:hypothetical protein
MSRGVWPFAVMLAFTSAGGTQRGRSAYRRAITTDDWRIIKYGAVRRCVASHYAGLQLRVPTGWALRKEVAVESHFDFPPKHPLNTGDNHRPGCRVTDTAITRRKGHQDVGSGHGKAWSEGTGGGSGSLHLLNT